METESSSETQKSKLLFDPEHEGNRIPRNTEYVFIPSRWKKQVPSKRGGSYTSTLKMEATGFSETLSTLLHGITVHNTVIFICTPGGLS
jgi:hypothetical protein